MKLIANTTAIAVMLFMAVVIPAHALDMSNMKVSGMVKTGTPGCWKSDKIKLVRPGTNIQVFGKDGKPPFVILCAGGAKYEKEVSDYPEVERRLVIKYVQNRLGIWDFSAYPENYPLAVYGDNGCAVLFWRPSPFSQGARNCYINRYIARYYGDRTSPYYYYP